MFKYDETIHLGSWWRTTIIRLHDIAWEHKRKAYMEAKISEQRDRLDNSLASMLEEVESAGKKQKLSWHQCFIRAGLLSAVLDYYQYQVKLNQSLGTAKSLVHQIFSRLDEVGSLEARLELDCLIMLYLADTGTGDPVESLQHLNDIDALSVDEFFNAMQLIYDDQKLETPTFDLTTADCHLNFIMGEGGAKSKLQDAYLDSYNVVLDLESGIKSMSKSRNYAAALEVSTAIVNLVPSMRKLEIALQEDFDAPSDTNRIVRHVAMNNRIVAKQLLLQLLSLIEKFNSSTAPKRAPRVARGLTLGDLKEPNN